VSYDSWPIKGRVRIISEGVSTRMCWSPDGGALLRGEQEEGEGVLMEELDDCTLGKGDDGRGVAGEAADDEHTSSSPAVVLLVGVVVCGGGVRIVVDDFARAVLAAVLELGFFGNGGVTEVVGTTVAAAAGPQPPSCFKPAGELPPLALPLVICTSYIKQNTRG
jgi:hypothetical protein